MRSRMTFEEMFACNALRIGNIYLRPQAVDEYLAKYCHALVLLNNDRNFPYSIFGSCSTLRNNNRHSLICTAHQIKSYTPDKVCFVPKIASWKTIITGHRFLYSNASEISKIEEEFVDINAIEFTPSNYSISNLQSEFFNVLDEDCWPNQTLNKFIVFGHPSSKVKYSVSEYDWNTKLESIHLVNTYCTAEYDGATEAKFCHRLKVNRFDELTVDGFSGGPVFHVGKDSKGLFIGFAGIAVRGHDSSDSMYCIEAAFIQLLFQY